MTRVLIRLGQQVSNESVAAFPQLTPSAQRAHTTLTGEVVDQEELQGVLNHLSSLGVRIVDVVTFPD